jgi:hypothetical protein
VANRGRRRSFSPETRARMSGAAKRRIADRTPEENAEAIERMRLANLGRSCPKSPEHREKLAAANRGKTHTTESRAKMSASHRGRKQSAEHIAKRAAARLQTIAARLTE